MEQQANIIADYFTLITAGYNVWKGVTDFQGIHGPDLLAKYQNTLQYFWLRLRIKEVYGNEMVYTDYLNASFYRLRG